MNGITSRLRGGRASLGTNPGLRALCRKCLVSQSGRTFARSLKMPEVAAKMRVTGSQTIFLTLGKWLIPVPAQAQVVRFVFGTREAVARNSGEVLYDGL